MKLLIPGGASHIGSWLVPRLLADGHQITVYDTLLFGDAFLPLDNENLTILKADVRDPAEWRKACAGQEAVIYLAGISRELVCQQNPTLANAINTGCFVTNVAIAEQEGIKLFIYASSVGVYGSSDVPMAEDTPLAPTTIYGKGKMECERILWEQQTPDFTCVAVRSAAVCGYAPRMRLDTTVNRMVHEAVRKGVITVEGGMQIRSHVHIQDTCQFYRFILTIPAEKVAGQAFNVVELSEPVIHTALRVAAHTGRKIRRIAGTDNSSYAVDGRKALTLGFALKKTILSAIDDVADKLHSGYWPDSETNPIYQNLGEHSNV